MMDTEFNNKADLIVRRTSQILVALMLTFMLVSECRRANDYKRVIYNYEDISKGVNETELTDENYKLIGEPRREYYTRSPRYIHFWDRYNYRDND